ncbi:MAG: PIG-L family deacetylase [Solobacterium sp.]|nr:PIG-L family deacetylase [Solobacterium sp.]MBR2794962.1 PIG-L family deacetylase [Solobacterium sp.]
MATVLVFAPHNDDEVLGVGGTIKKLTQAGNDVIICEATTGPNAERADRIKKEALRAHELLGIKDTIFLDLPLVRLNTVPKDEINAAFGKVVKEIRPDAAYIPHSGDMHIDHRVVADAAMVALRPVDAPFVKAIYAYETLSESEWNIPSPENIFIPTSFSNITGYLDAKIEAMKCFETQLREFPQPRSAEAIISLAKVRGSTICVDAAEAFKVIRLIQ